MGAGAAALLHVAAAEVLVGAGAGALLHVAAAQVAAAGAARSALGVAVEVAVAGGAWTALAVLVEAAVGLAAGALGVTAEAAVTDGAAGLATAGAADVAVLAFAGIVLAGAADVAVAGGPSGGEVAAAARVAGAERAVARGCARLRTRTRGHARVGRATRPLRTANPAHGAVLGGAGGAAVGFLADATVVDGLGAALALFVEGGVAALVAALTEAVEVLVLAARPGAGGGLAATVGLVDGGSLALRVTGALSSGFLRQDERQSQQQ